MQVAEVVLRCLMSPGEAPQKGTVFSCDLKNEWEADSEEGGSGKALSLVLEAQVHRG